MIPLDLRKMERPHSSGVRAVLIVYATMWFYGYVVGMNLPSSEHFSLRTIYCWTFTWACLDNGSELEAENEKNREYRIIHLSPFPSKKNAPHVRTIHWDEERVGVIIHHRLSEMQECPKEWPDIGAWADVAYDDCFKIVLERWRWHCD